MNRGSIRQFALVIPAALALIAGLVLSDGAAGPFDELSWLVLGLTIVLAAALVGGHVAAVFGQPAALGEILAGLLLGNLPGLGSLRFVATDPYLDILARLGMLLLLFEVGLDLSVRDLFAVGPSALLVALIGSAASLALGTIAATLLSPGSPFIAHLILGGAVAATSIGITARVLRDMGAARSGEAKIILGAAVVDDVLALVLLSTVTAWVSRGRAGNAHETVASPLALILKTGGFLVLAIVLGQALTRSGFRKAAEIRIQGAQLAVGLCFCFAVAWMANAIGLAALVGAFAAGLVLEDVHSEPFVRRGEPPLNVLLQPLVSFLVPVFFVLVGFRTNFGTLLSPIAVALAGALTIASVLGKMASAAGVLRRAANRWVVAIGMIPRGEVALIFAALGRTIRIGSRPLIDDTGYAALIAVVIVTTLVTPPALKWSLRRAASQRGITRPAA